MSRHAPGRPSFSPLFIGDAFGGTSVNGAVRDATRGIAGVYLLKRAGVVRYVGSSVPGEKGGRETPLRFWKTVLRHFQRCAGVQGTTRRHYGFGDDNFCTRAAPDWEIAIYETTPDDARKVEAELIEQHKPPDQPKGPRTRKERKRNPPATKTRYTTRGLTEPDACGHEHATIDAALECLARNAATRERKGSETRDTRCIVRTDGKLFTVAEEDELWHAMDRCARKTGRA